MDYKPIFMSHRSDIIDEDPTIRVGSSIIKVDPDLRTRGFISVYKNDINEKIIKNDDSLGVTLQGGAIQMISLDKELELLSYESSIAAYTYDIFLDKSDDEIVNKIIFSIIGESCPEYFNQKRREIFKITVREGDQVYDLSYWKDKKIREFPKGSYNNWLSAGNTKYHDILMKDEGRKFELTHSHRDYLYVSDKSITVADVRRQLNISPDISDFEIDAKIYNIDTIIHRILSGDSSINVKNVAIIGDNPSEVWGLRTRYDSEISHYLKQHNNAG